MSAPPTLVEILSAHPRSDWSDTTYSCSGCSQRVLDRVDADPTMAPRDRMRAYTAASHPRWTLLEYHQHVADAVQVYVDEQITAVHAEYLDAARDRRGDV